MKTTIVAAIILIGISEQARAQYAIQNNPHNITGSSSILKTEIPLAAPSVIGSTYLDDNWQNARITLRGGAVVENCPIRVEIEQANVEIKFKGEVKYLNLSKVDFINTADANGTPIIIRSAKQYSLEDVPLEGIVSVEHLGKEYGVIKHFYIEVLLANYNVAMDVGSKDHRIVKKERIYISQNSKLFAVKGSDKKLIAKLGLDRKRTLKLIRENNLNLSNEADLISFVKLLEKEG
jgi:hypothetical protein